MRATNRGFKERLFIGKEEIPMRPIKIKLFRREKNDFWKLYTLELPDTVELACLGVRFLVAEAYQDTSLGEEE